MAMMVVTRHVPGTLKGASASLQCRLRRRLRRRLPRRLRVRSGMFGAQASCGILRLTLRTCGSRIVGKAGNGIETPPKTCRNLEGGLDLPSRHAVS